MAKLKLYINNCEKCPLHETRNKIAQPRYKGKAPFDVLFMGIGPGRVEDFTGKTFVGASGKMMNRLINEAKIESFIMINTVFCHPTNKKNGDNRDPNKTEIMSCMENVKGIIRRSRPKNIVFVGSIPEKYYKKFYGGSKMIHPSAILRTGNISGYNYNRVILRDVKNRLNSFV